MPGAEIAIAFEFIGEIAPSGVAVSLSAIRRCRHPIRTTWGPPSVYVCEARPSLFALLASPKVRR